MFVQWLIIATASARSISFCSYYYYGFTRLPPKLVYFYLLLTDWLKWDLLHYASLLARGHVFTLAYCTTLYKEQTQESDRGTWGQAIAKILGGPTSGSNNFLLLTFSSAAVSHSFQRVKSTRLAVAQHVQYVCTIDISSLFRVTNDETRTLPNERRHRVSQLQQRQKLNTRRREQFHLEIDTRQPREKEIERGRLS